MPEFDANAPLVEPTEEQARARVETEALVESAAATQESPPPGSVPGGVPPVATSITLSEVDRANVVEKIIKNYRDDIQDRHDWNEARIQRTAKYRGWREEKSYPWPGASNAHLPIIMTDVQRTEDTLHNAVLAVRPVMNAKASMPNDVVKERGLDMLLDYQVFKENDGETRIAKLISAFVQDGMFVAFTPYVQEKQVVTQLYQIPFPQAGSSWDNHVWEALRRYYPKAVVLPTSSPWRFEVREVNQLTDEETSFFCDVERNGDNVQLRCRKDEMSFDGPCLIPKELEDVVVPVRCENLQPRTVANPTGADRVILVDYPTLDEIKRLQRRGFYDLLTDEDMKKIEGTAHGSRQPGVSASDPEGQKRLKDDLEGRTPAHVGSEDTPKVYTRLMYFGRHDHDGDGLEEDVIYWVIEEAQVLCRARYLTDVYPSNPPRRPLQCAKYIPVNDRFYAIGLIELMESAYDIIKETFDQMMDNGTIANLPFGFYKPMSSLKPEGIKLSPGVLIPAGQPSEDVYFPPMNTGSAAFGANVIGLVMQILDQVTMIGQLQLGGVPQGKSAALRTSSNMQSLMAQGDARPERVMRRFFNGLADVWRQFHILDKAFLSPGKRFRIQAEMEEGQTPYLELSDPRSIDGDYDFEFGATILNTNKQLANAALQDLLGVLTQPVLMMLGIVGPDNIYTLLKEYIRSKGQDPRKYLHPPTPMQADNRPMFTAEDAIQAAVNGALPYGQPIEPIEEHLSKILQFMQGVAGSQSPDQYISPEGARILGMYAAQVQNDMQQRMQMQQMLQGMQQLNESTQQPGQPGPQGESNPPSTSPSGNPPVQGNELIDESLPGAGGGASGKK